MNFRARLLKQLERADVGPPNDAALDRLEAYFDLLARWNATINLTALDLEPPSDEALDRLFTEPLAAARYFPAEATNWFDLGSGGGSPAIPLQVVVNCKALTMIESRERKAAFLREAVRTLEIAATVMNARFEDVAGRPDAQRQADVVTVRAVRPDASMFSSASALLRPSGRLLIFQNSAQSLTGVGTFKLREAVPLLPSKPALLTIYST